MIPRVLPFLTAVFLFGGGLVHAAESRLGVATAEALRAARERQAYWSLGRLMVRHEWLGHSWIQAELLDDGRVVARLRVDPATGGFLAADTPHTGGGDAGDLMALRPAVERSLHHLEIGDWMWPTEHGQAWGVPLRYGAHVVGTLKVDVQRRLLMRSDDD